MDLLQTCYSESAMLKYTSVYLQVVPIVVI